MSHRVTWWRGFAVVGVLSIAAGCAAPPEKEMHLAQGAIEAARAAGAPAYAPAEFEAAVAALKKSETAVTDRDYRLALSAALDARERAQEAARAAAENRVRLRSEIDALIAGSEAALGGVTLAITAAKSAKVPASQLGAATSAAAQAEKALASARAAAEAGDYDAARTTLEGVPSRLDAAKADVEAATLARTTRRPARRATR